jgi:hypothetical protein
MTEEYRTKLRAMIIKWFAWRKQLLSRGGLSRELLSLLWAGLMFYMHESAYSTLGLSISRNCREIMRQQSLAPAPHTTGRELWRYMKNQKQANRPSQHTFSSHDTLQHMMKVANESIIPAQPGVERLVALSNTYLPEPTSLDSKQRTALSQRWTNVSSSKARKLKDGSAAGPEDRIPPELVKHAPVELHSAIAEMTLDCVQHGYFPEQMHMGLMSYLYKGKGLPKAFLSSSRGIRVTSVPGKLVATVLSDLIFPVDATFEESINAEQFAGRKHHSADLLVLVLQLIIHCAGSSPLYIILVDIQKAFDTLWRDALWHKLLQQGHNKSSVAWLKSFYNKLITAVRAGDGISEYVQLLHGIGQGDPNSTKFYGAFLSDLPSFLGGGVQVCGVLITALLFLDDIAVPCSSQAQVRNKLRKLSDYGRRWRITYNLEKSVVL